MLDSLLQLKDDIFYLIISNVAVQVVDKNVDSKSVMKHFIVSIVFQILLFTFKDDSFISRFIAFLMPNANDRSYLI